MQQDDIAQWVFALETSTQKLEQRSRDAVKRLEVASANAGEVVQQAGRAALAAFEQGADEVLQAKISSFQAASGTLERQMQDARKIFTGYAWKTFIACAVASLMVIGVTVYEVAKGRQELVRTEWVGQINAAVANQRLAICPQGEGICARVDKRWVRLDQ